MANRSGACQTLMAERHIRNYKALVETTEHAITLGTANGTIKADKRLPIYINEFDESTNLYILPNTPAVLSVGLRCRHYGCSFIWRKHENRTSYYPVERPYHCKSITMFHTSTQHRQKSKEHEYFVANSLHAASRKFAQHGWMQQQARQTLNVNHPPQPLGEEDNTPEDIMDADDPEQTAEEILQPSQRPSLRHRATSLPHLLTH